MTGESMRNLAAPLVRYRSGQVSSSLYGMVYLRHKGGGLGRSGTRKRLIPALVRF